MHFRDFIGKKMPGIFLVISLVALSSPASAQQPSSPPSYGCYGIQVAKEKIPELISTENTKWIVGDCAELADPKPEQIRTLIERGWRITTIQGRSPDTKDSRDLKPEQQEKVIKAGTQLAQNYAKSLSGNFPIESAHGVISHGILWNKQPTIVVRMQKQKGQHGTLTLQSPSGQELAKHLTARWHIEKIIAAGPVEEQLCALHSAIRSARYTGEVISSFTAAETLPKLEVNLRWPRESHYSHSWQ